VFPDGNHGIDNAFGKRLLPILSIASGDAEDSGGSMEDAINASLGAGTSGLVIHLRDLGAGDNYDPIDAYVYRADGIADGGWAINVRSLSDPDADFDTALLSGVAHFPASYVNQGVWVADQGAKKPTTIDLVWEIAGQPLRLRIHDPVVSMPMTAEHGEVVRGVIAGVLFPGEVITQARLWVTSVLPDACGTASLDGVFNQIRQASDIVIGSKQDANVICDGISIGFEFDAIATSVSEISPDTLPPDPCL
jgi:hypothetical protein